MRCPCRVGESLARLLGPLRQLRHDGRKLFASGDEGGRRFCARPADVVEHDLFGVDEFVGDVGDEGLVRRILKERKIQAIIHFAGSIVVPESVSDPLGYYLNNTVKSRALIAAAVASGVKQFIFSSTAAVYGAPAQVPVLESTQLSPMSPYGSSKLMKIGRASCRERV